MKLFCTLLVVLFLNACGSRSQDYSAFHPVRSIDPENTEYSDLEFLKGVIGDSRIVLLGEQSHGEGAVFLAKTRLIKLLHEQMDYDILAFESGIFDCAILWDSLQVFTGDADPLLTAQKAVFGIWTRSKQLRDIFRYLIEQTKTDTPLRVCGFDSQFTGEFSESYVIPELRRICNRYDIQYKDTLAGSKFEKILLRLSYDFEYVPHAGRSKLFFTQLHDLEQSFREKEHLLDERGRIMQQTLRSANALALEQFNDGGFALREAQMAKNLQFLCDLYPDKKIIVWAASSHIMTDNTSVDDDRYKQFVPMGTLFRDSSDVTTTTVGFTSYGGETYDHYKKAPV